MQARLITLLQCDPAAGGISLTGTLQTLQPLKIDDIGALQTTKEHWRWENCQASLATNGLYEAPGSLFWMSTERASWDGEVLPATELTYGQMAAGRLMWSLEKFIRSSEEEHKRRYLINGTIPSAVASMADVPSEPDGCLVNLPCLGSRAIIAGWYSVMDDALRASAVGGKVLK